jgi:hypothetical protein
LICNDASADTVTQQHSCSRPWMLIRAPFGLAVTPMLLARVDEVIE